jgi:hypothetical protein
MLITNVMSVLNNEYFRDEAAASAKLEKHRLAEWSRPPSLWWQKRIYTLKGVKDKKDRVRLGLRNCGHCCSQFTMRVDTVFESSHIPVHKWLQAVYLMCASKKGISAHQLHRTLGITYEAAWFMAHRIKEAMRSGPFRPLMGGDGGVVEVDETIYCRAATHPKRRKPKNAGFRNAVHKNVILSLVERGGEVRSLPHGRQNRERGHPHCGAQHRKESTVITNAARPSTRSVLAAYERIDHSKEEYVRYEPGKPLIHTNAVEGYFSPFKRGMWASARKHLHRYVAEFDFQHNNSSRLGEYEERAERDLRGMRGERLTYRQLGRLGSNQSA